MTPLSPFGGDRSRSRLSAFRLLFLVAFGSLLPSILGMLEVPGLAALESRAHAEDPVQVSVIAPTQPLPVGARFPLAAVFEMDHEWHITVPQELLSEGSDAYATRLKLLGPEGAKASAQQWPAFQRIDFFGTIIEGYEKKAVVFIPVELDPSLTGKQTLSVEFHYQTCDHEKCFPPNTKVATVEVEIADGATPFEVPTDGVFSGFDAKVFASTASAAGASQKPDLFGGEEFIKGSPLSSGLSNAPSGKPVTLKLQVVTPTVQGGGVAQLELIFSMQGKWHVNPPAALLPEDSYQAATEITYQLPTGFIASADWPQPHAVMMSGMEVLAYEHELKLPISVQVPRDVQGEQKISLSVNYQTCDDQMCLPPETVSLEGSFVVAGVVAAATDGSSAVGEGAEGATPIPAVGNDAVVDVPAADGEFEEVKFVLFGYELTANSFWLLLVFAALGGFLLNLTPCVLPVIPLKIMNLTNASHDGARAAVQGTVMCLGIIAFWMVIGGMIVGVQGFDSISSLFQTPYFSIGVGLFIGLMGIGMLGMFDVGLPQWVYKINPSNDSYIGSFGFGVMTAVLSTPCTAPFMGTAAAWAVGKPTPVVLGVFGSIGLGMALPYEVLALKPGLVSKLPKSGPGSVLMKQVMGLLMLAVACFFGGAGLKSLVTTQPHLGPVLYWWGTLVMVCIAAGWTILKTFQISKSNVRRAIASVLALALCFAMFQWTDSQTAESERRVTARREQQEARDKHYEQLKEFVEQIEAGGGVVGEVPQLEASANAWQDFSWTDLDKSRDEDKVVVIEYTADW